MPTYDPRTLQKYADELYREAGEVVRSHAVVAGLIGAFVGGAVASGSGGRGMVVLVAALVLGAVGAGMGRQMGRRAGDKLRMMAQMALCQVAIEQNSRRPQAAEARPASTLASG
jgi:hypothetical protein